jgi:protein phosphatase
MTLAVKAATDRGLRREHNQDYYGFWTPDDPAECDRQGVLLVVADGMGGARGGEVASRLAVEALLRAYREGKGGSVLPVLAEALQTANREVHRENLKDPNLAGMGTTCTAAVVCGSELFVAHVGDSRAYLVRKGSIRQLTRDHSLVAYLVEEKSLTPEEARVDPRRNLVTRSLGLSADVEVDAFAVESGIGPGDTLLLCSDGLHGSVDDHELARAASGRDLAQVCQELIALANGAGGTDNITVVLARLETEDAEDS